MRPLILAASTRLGFVDDLVLCLTHLFFGLEPVVEFRAGLIAASESAWIEGAIA